MQMLFGESTHPKNQSNLMDSLPYDHAVRRIYEGRVTKDELLAGLKAPVNKQARQIENRIKFVLMARYKEHGFLRDTLSEFDRRMPPWLCNEVNQFKEYKEYFVRINRYTESQLGQHSFEWAKNLVVNSPETAAHVCSMRDMSFHYSIAFHNIAFQSEVVTSKKQSPKSDEKFISRTFRRLATASQSLADDGADPYGSDAIISIANSFFGGTRTLMIMLLGSHYRSTYIYLSSIILGMYASDFASQRSETLLDHDDVRELMRNTCQFIDVLGEDSFLAMEASGSLASLVARQHAWKQHYYSACAQDFLKLIVFERNNNKNLNAEIAALKAFQAKSDRLKKLEIDKLSETAEVVRLRTENEQLHKELKKASEIVILREQKIARLADKISELESPDVVEQRLEAPIAPFVEVEVEVDHSGTLEENQQKLNTIRGVVVGGHANFISKIRRLLPGWKFHSTDDTSLDESSIIGADVVVLFTKYASHKITEKPLKICRQRNIPIFYATRTNPPSFLNEIAGHIGKVANFDQRDTFGG